MPQALRNCQWSQPGDCSMSHRLVVAARAETIILLTALRRYLRSECRLMARRADSLASARSASKSVWGSGNDDLRRGISAATGTFAANAIELAADIAGGS